MLYSYSLRDLEHVEKPHLLLSFDYAQDGEPVEPQFHNFGCPSTTLRTVSEVEPQTIHEICPFRSKSRRLTLAK